MKKCIDTNIEEPQKLHSRKKINNNNHSHNCNYTEDILSKVNTNLQVKKQESIHTKGAINHKLNQQREFCKRTSAPVLKENTACTKKTMHLTNNNMTINQKKEGHKQSQRSAKRLHGKVLSDSTLSYISPREIDKNVKNQIEVKSQGIQTLNTTEIDHLYSEGIIKYPSKKNFNESLNKNKRNQEIDKSSSDAVNLAAEQGDTQIVEKTLEDKNDSKNLKAFSSKEETDFIKLNREHCSTTNKVATPIKNTNSHNNCKYNNSNTNTPIANHRMGVVPKYIKERKETLEKIQKAKTEELDANCPDGHVLLPDHERKETLRVLRKNYQDYVNELNMMPIKVDTLRAQRRKIEIEKQLNKLEEGIKVFSRPKVYVKMNE
ncbi:uncharacterized protein LOC100883810 isoform X2 [Megachile rotundata]